MSAARASHLSHTLATASRSQIRVRSVPPAPIFLRGSSLRLFREASCAAEQFTRSRPAFSARASAEPRMHPDSKDAPRVLLVSDLDNTMVDHKDPEHKALKEFGALWQKDYGSDSLLVYSTGRSPHLYRELKEQVPLITPDMVICSVGTEICRGAEMTPDAGWGAYLDQGWDRAAALEEAGKFEKLRLQRDSEQRPHKVSFNVEKQDAGPIVEALEKRLKERGVRCKIIYSGGHDLDILPEGAGKGKALEYLLRTLGEQGRQPGKTLACGDSGNDIELFTVPGAYGVVVGNAMEELADWYAKQQQSGNADHVFKATERCAAGIMQAMKNFGV